MPLNLRAINAIIARLQQIAVANGYETDIGATVFHGRRQVEPDELPCLLVYEAGETAQNTSPSPANGTTESMRVTLDINVEAYLDTPPRQEGPGQSLAKADVKRAVLRYDEPALTDANGRISGPVTYLGAEPILRADGTAVDGVVVRFQVSLIEGYGNPDGPR